MRGRNRTNGGALYRKIKDEFETLLNNGSTEEGALNALGEKYSLKPISVRRYIEHARYGTTPARHAPRAKGLDVETAIKLVRSGLDKRQCRLVMELVSGR